MLLRYDDEGPGPAVVLLHSAVCDRRMWDPQMAGLTSRFRVVRPDLRGFGETPLPAEQFGFADDVIALLDRLDIGRVAVVGSSMGGRVALELAAGWPDRVNALVLLCPAFRGVDSTAAADEFEEREETLLEAGDIDGAVELNVATWLGPEASKETRKLVALMQRHAFDVQLAAEEGDDVPELDAVHPDLADIRAPTLIVSGDLDMDHFRNVAEHLRRTIEKSRLVTLTWAGHLPSLERPDDVTDLLTTFLAETLASTPE